jgi:uroporphyrinogen decarboxylase
MSLFIDACYGKPTARTPIWLMRQAGRYMPEYRAIRAKADFWQLCHDPDLATEVTLQPIQAFGMDAAILFSDILIPLPEVGFEVRFDEGKGPVLPNPIKKATDVEKFIAVPMSENLSNVGKAVRQIVKALPGNTPLIGFAGAPFTLASYLIEGGSSKEFMKTKSFLHQEPKAAHVLFQKLTDVVIDFLSFQVDSGCKAVQIFDSWAGCLDPDDYAIWGLFYTKQIVEALQKKNVPVIVFAKGTHAYMDVVAQCNADAYGVDWTTRLSQARAMVGPKAALQGNLDPGKLLAPWPEIEKSVRKILDQAGNGTGHIFNLGHGIYQHTPVDHVKQLTDFIKEKSHLWRA